MSNGFLIRLGATGIIVFTASFSGANANGLVKTNREVLFELCEQATKSLIDSSGSSYDSAVALTVERDTLSHYFSQAVIESFHRHFHLILLKENDSLRSFIVSVIAATVRYGDSFTNGMFGTRRCERDVEFGLQATVVGPSGERVQWAGKVSQSFRDTISVDDIASLEPPGGIIGRANPPQSSFIDALVAPFVIIAATGVVVYLFFTIRS